MPLLACSLLENFALNMESGPPGAAGGGAGAHGGGGGGGDDSSDSDSDVGLGERTASFVKAEVGALLQGGVREGAGGGGVGCCVGAGCYVGGRGGWTEAEWASLGAE